MDEYHRHLEPTMPDTKEFILDDRSQASHFTHLCLSFFICKMGVLKLAFAWIKHTPVHVKHLARTNTTKWKFPFLGASPPPPCHRGLIVHCPSRRLLLLLPFSTGPWPMLSSLWAFAQAVHAAPGMPFLPLSFPPFRISLLSPLFSSNAASSRKTLLQEALCQGTGTQITGAPEAAALCPRCPPLPSAWIDLLDSLLCTKYYSCHNQYCSVLHMPGCVEVCRQRELWRWGHQREPWLLHVSLLFQVTSFVAKPQ